MRRLWAIAPVLALAAACTSSDGGTTSSAPPSPTDPVTTSATSAPTSTPPSSPSTPAGPTVPADVPTTGPNTKPGEKPPVMPVVATRHTAAGAKAFAEFFIRTIDWAYATTSTTYMKHYFVRSCVACASAAASIDRAAALEHHFIGDRFTIRSVTGPANLAIPVVTVRFNITSVEVVDKNDKFINGDGALSDFREVVSIAWSNNSWKVTKMVPR